MEIDLGSKSVAIVGSGLVGCLLGVYLRQHNFDVTIFEARPDPRLGADGGRSINLVITSRGIAALTGVSAHLAEKVMAVTVPVFGRTLHAQDGACTYQAYGPDASHCNFSVSRWELNTVLLTAAEEAGCRVFFNHPLAHLDVPTSTLFFYLQDRASTQLFQKRVKCGHVFAADGGGSRCRQALKGHLGAAAADVARPLRYGYKELFMPAHPSMDTKSLHIWPRGSHFLMALPNKDHSFTMTLYMPEKGDVSFGALGDDPAKIRQYMETHYADAARLMPGYLDEYARNPVGFLGTVFCSPWVFEDRLALIGDAAHAITPFFGQGCNSGFEDVAVLHTILSRMGTADMAGVFRAYHEARKPNGDAIGNMALDNFTEMMSKTADPHFLLCADIGLELARRFPALYATRYSLVTHSLVPYALCREIGMAQDDILAELARGVTRAADVDWAAAERLVRAKLAPLLQAHGITPDQFTYKSKYYPSASL